MELDQEHIAIEGPVEETGFLENAKAAWDVTVDEDLSISEYLHQGAYEERNRQVDEQIRAGSIPREEYEPYIEGDEIDYSRMSYDLKRRGRPLMDDYDVRGNIRTNLEEQRNRATDIHERSSGMGAVGSFAGSMAGFAVDPVNMAGMLIPGYGMVRGASLMTYAGKAALYYGATGVATESVIQPAVMDWKQKIGVNYTAGDAITNIAMAGLSTAVLGTALEVGAYQVKEGFRRIKDNVRLKERPEVAGPIIETLDRAEAEYDMAVQGKRMEDMAVAKENIDEQLMYYNELQDAAQAIDETADPYGDIIDALEDDADFFQRLEDQGVAPKLDDPVDMGLERDIRKAEKLTEQYAAAKELGYDVETPVYRGAIHGDQLHRDEVFLSPDPTYAELYSVPDDPDVRYMTKEGMEEDLDFDDPRTWTTAREQFPEKYAIEAAPIMGKFFMKTDKLYSLKDTPGLIDEFRDWLAIKISKDTGKTPDGDALDTIDYGMDYVRTEYQENKLFDWTWMQEGYAREFLDEVHPDWEGIKLQEGFEGKLNDTSYLFKKEGIAPVWTDFKAELAASNKRMGEEQTKWMEDQLEELRAEAEMLRKDPETKFRRMKAHNERMREDPVYKIDTVILKGKNEGKIDTADAMLIRRYLDNITDDELARLGSIPEKDLLNELLEASQPRTGYTDPDKYAPDPELDPLFEKLLIKESDKFKTPPPGKVRDILNEPDWEITTLFDMKRYVGQMSKEDIAKLNDMDIDELRTKLANEALNAFDDTMVPDLADKFYNDPNFRKTALRPTLKLVKAERPAAPSGLDAETDTIAKQLEEIGKREEAKILDDTVPDMFADFDERSFMDMTPEKRDALVAKMLGEEGVDESTLGSQEIEYETGQLDSDGNMMYKSKSADEIYDELDEMSDSLDDFLECWNSPDAED